MPRGARTRLERHAPALKRDGSIAAKSGSTRIVLLTYYCYTHPHHARYGTDDGDWKPGVNARLAFATASADRLPSLNFQTDNDDLQTQLRIANGPRVGIEINSGLFVYYYDDVL